jgi:Cu(I)/Ag(I) efflux system membrane fusion protein
MNNQTRKFLSLGIVFGVLLTVSVYLFFISPFTSERSHESIKQQEKSDVPLYWVAPMDANFKRDKPGKSPMGMDLVPVYANVNSDRTGGSSPGTVTIDPVTIQNLGVKTATIDTVIPKLTINTFGQVTFAQDSISNMHPRVAGWVETLFVRAKGEFIEKGAPVYSLYAPDLVNAQDEFILALNLNNNALIKAARSRLAALNAPDSLIKAIEKTRNTQRTITFYAPKSGVVSQLNIQDGMYVKPSTLMLTIASMDSIWVLADIFANDLGKIAIGQPATMTFESLPGRRFSAELQYIYPSLNNATRTATARFVLPNPDLVIKPEMFANVNIHADLSHSMTNTNTDMANNDMVNSDNILAVPVQAVIRTGGQDRVVLALGDGRYKSIAVTIGNQFNDVYAVIDGLVAGDEVVTSAQFLLDSESSISSDFLRMEAPSQLPMQVPSHVPVQESEITSAWTHATVNDVMVSDRLVNLTHGPLDAFNMMGMTMNFSVAAGIDIQQFQVGDQVHVEIVEGMFGMYQINTVHFTRDMDDMYSDHDQGEQQ